MQLNEDLVKDLKSSHFDFGAYNLKANHSQYVNHFRPWENDKVEATGKALNKQSHIHFGSYNPKNFYVSNKNTDFSHPGKQERVS